jgi:hypothetical protein
MFLSGRTVEDLDIFSKSDPFVVISDRSTPDEEWSELGRTEIIWNNLNPDWTTSFELDFHFAEQRYLQFKVYNANDAIGTVSRADFIGETI